MHSTPSPSSSPKSKSSDPDRLFLDQFGMQDIHSIFGVGGVGGGRMRAAPHGHHLHHQALKCPRCDSLNTKFCYYNNYNLSQPRHFCKNCRRYWTKGGVLRNVPVGGGCRKSKRSSKRASRRSSHSNSSSESTSTNANANADVALAAASSSPLLPPTMPMGFVGQLDEGEPLQHNHSSLAETTTTTPLFGIQQQDPWGQGMVFDQSADPGEGGLAGGEWQGVSVGAGAGGGHLCMFDLTPGSDWSQSSQWHESDHHLYLPP